MNAAPDSIDPVRRDAVRSLLQQTVADSAAGSARSASGASRLSQPTLRSWRIGGVAFIVAATVLVIGGAGIVFAHQATAPGGGTAVAPPATSDPEPSNPVEPSPSTSVAPGLVAPAGTATPVPTPAPAPTAYSESDTGSWTVSFDGIGPLGIGHGQKADAALMSQWRELTHATCRVIDFQDDGFGPNFATSSTDQAPGVTNYVRVGDGFDASEDPADLAALSPRTATGVRIGSSLAQLQAAYPSASHEGEGPNPSSGTLDYWSVSNGSGRYMDFGLGTDGQVATITVTVTPIPPDEQSDCG